MKNVNLIRIGSAGHGHRNKEWDKEGGGDWWEVWSWWSGGGCVGLIIYIYIYLGVDVRVKKNKQVWAVNLL